ncbi:MAG TPA: outer membrane beta-barrel domain-containing protein [Candidatus Udaeobacter sp.]|jgi:outer membrane beta-barrel protein|nr:outer membrane beta-barrel domain-containing protein [Candidatus Udaeobacter sp.]
MKRRDPHPIVGAGRRSTLALLIAAGSFAAALPREAGAASAVDSLAVTASIDSAATAPADSVPTAASVTAPHPAAFPASPNAHINTTRKVRLTHSDRNVVRLGPGDSFAIAGVYPRGATFTVIAKSGPWYNVRLSDSETGWIHSALCKEYDDLSDLEFKPNPRLYSRTGSFVIGGYGGAYAFDRKSNSLVLGGRLGYYVFDRLQAEAGLAWTHVRRPAEIVESLFDLSLEEESFHMLSYYLGGVWELLPGRQMVPFVSGGIGASMMQGETEPGFNFGGGTALFISKRTAVRWEVRDFRFKTGPPDARVTNHNIEFSFGSSYLF